MKYVTDFLTRVFQTACANYFLCDIKSVRHRSRMSSFKPLARIISSVTPNGAGKSVEPAGFKPLARIISSVTTNPTKFKLVSISFKPLARIISSVTRSCSANLPTRKWQFQTACANYFLCDRIINLLFLAPFSTFLWRVHPVIAPSFTHFDLQHSFSPHLPQPFANPFYNRRLPCPP